MQTTNSLLAIVLFVLVSGGSLVAGHIETYKQWHDVCLQGDTKQIDAQIAKYEGQLTKNSKDHLARAYLGSACALRAKASFWGPTKLKFLKRGKSNLDAAVTGAPKDPRVRMVRAIGYYKVPKRFGTRPIALKDFQWLAPISKNPKSDLKVNERQAILYYAWLTYTEEKQAGAAEVKKACHQLDPKSSYGQLTK